MKRFYANINPFKGKQLKVIVSIFIGVQFKDSDGKNVTCNEEYFKIIKRPKFSSVSNEKSEVCGTETNNSSEWISLGGPTKGSYAIKH